MGYDRGGRGGYDDRRGGGGGYDDRRGGGRDDRGGGYDDRRGGGRDYDDRRGGGGKSGGKGEKYGGRQKGDDISEGGNRHVTARELFMQGSKSRRRSPSSS